MGWVAGVLKFLPEAASSPLAFVAYVVAIAAAVIVAISYQRNVAQQKLIDSLPAQDRQNRAREIVGKPLPEDVTADQWLKGERQKLLFAGFCVVCLTVVCVFAISVWRSQPAGPTDDPDKARVRMYASGENSPYIDYQNCNGSKWQAKWEGDGFFHTPIDGGSPHPDTVLDYVAWDGSCWHLTWDATQHKFVERPVIGSGEFRVDAVRYRGWDMGRWTATRLDGTTFHHEKSP